MANDWQLTLMQKRVVPGSSDASNSSLLKHGLQWSVAEMQAMAVLVQ